MNVVALNINEKLPEAISFGCSVVECPRWHTTFNFMSKHRRNTGDVCNFQHFAFALTCDVKGNPEVTKICSLSNFSTKCCGMQLKQYNDVTDRVGFLVCREPGEYNWMRVCSRPGLSPPSRVNNSRLAAGPQSTEVQTF